MAISKVKTKSGKVKWEARIYLNGRDGKQIRRRFDTKRDAEDYLDDLKSETREMKRTGFSTNVMEEKLFAEEAEYWLLGSQYRFSESHHKRARGVLKEILPKFGKLPIARFTPTLLMDFQHAQLKKGKTPATVNRKTEVITAILNFSFRHRRIPFNPTAGFQKLKRKPAEMGFLGEKRGHRLFKMYEREPSKRIAHQVAVCGLSTSVEHGNASWRNLGADAQGFFQGRALYICGSSVQPC
jgi:hypothetical protein